MKAFTIAFWKEWTSALRERRELLSAFAYALAGPLMIAVLITSTAREARDTGPEPWRYCDASAQPAALTQFLTGKGMRESPDAAACLEVASTYDADLAAGRSTPVTIVADLNAADKPARKLKTAVDEYGRTLAAARLTQSGLTPDAAHPLATELRNSSAIGPLAFRLVGALILFLICAPFFICQSTAIDTTAGERERRGLEPMLIQPMPRASLVLAKFAITFLVGLAGTLATIAIALVAIRKTPIGELGVEMVLGGQAAVICTLMLIPVIAAVAALQIAIGLWARTFKEGQTYALLFAFTPVALGFGALMGGGGGLQPWPVMFEIAALKAPLLGAPWPDLTSWIVSAAISLGIAALALGLSIWRLGDERLLAET